MQSYRNIRNTGPRAWQAGLLSLLLMLALAACEDDSDDNGDEPTPSQADRGEASRSRRSDQAMRYEQHQSRTAAASQDAEGSDKRNAVVPACADVTTEATANAGADGYPKRITIDYGSSGCTCPDGKTRRGIVEARVTGEWYASTGSNDSLILDYQAYYVNDTQYVGTATYVKTDYNQSNGTAEYEWACDDGGFRAAEDTLANWQVQATLQYEDGLSTTADASDDVLRISGSSAGEFPGTASAESTAEAEAQSFEVQIQQRLTYDGSCQRCTYTAGRLDMTTTAQSDSTLGGVETTIDVETDLSLSYGDGSCDGEAGLEGQVRLINSGAIDGSVLSTTALEARQVSCE
jgi:hypothetical protein